MILRALLLLCCLPLSLPAATPGEPAPPLVASELRSAEPVDLAALRGRVVLVDFWASWCAPCLKSLPLYQTLREEWPRADFEILAVNVDEDVADAHDFLSRVQVEFPIVHDDGRLASAWAPPAMPSAYLIDRDGRIHSRHLGFRPGDIDGLRNEVRNLIEARDAP